MSKPIIFTTESVQQIIRNVKTQSRRVKEGHKCVYGVKGQTLWVRESWRKIFRETKTSNGLIYRADYGLRADLGENYHPDGNGFWKSPLFLSAIDARLHLELIETPYEERLMDICNDDIAAEGVLRDSPDVARDAFAIGWDAMNAKRGFPFHSNPAVWVLKFKVISVNLIPKEIRGYNKVRGRHESIVH